MIRSVFLFLGLTLFSASALAGWQQITVHGHTYHSISSEGPGSMCAIWLGSYANGWHKSVPHSSNSDRYYSYSWTGGGSPCPEEDSEWDNDSQACTNPNPQTGDTAIGQCRAWSPECNDSTIVDSNGDVWTNDGLGICDMDICLNQYTKTDQTVDPNDPTTWPEGSIASDDFNAPTLPGTSEDSPFDNWTQGFPAAVDTEVDTQTSSSSDGSTSTTTKTTELGVDESGPFKTETTQTTSTDSSGNTTTTTTTKTTDSSGNVSTSTTSSTTDSGGTVTGSTSSSSTDQGGEQETDGVRVSGSGSCSVIPSCDGDPVGCALLIQQHKDACGEFDLVTGINDCSSDPVCDGDPIICSLIQQKHSEVCELRDQDTALAAVDTGASSLGLADLDTVEAQMIADGYERDKEVDLSDELSAFTEVATTSGTCPDDITISLGGSMAPIVLDMSNHCSLFQWIGAIVRFAASLVGFMMIFNTIREL